MTAISFLTTITITTNMYAYADSLNFVNLNVIVNPNAHVSSSNVPHVIYSPQVINTPNVAHVPNFVNTSHRVNIHVIITHHLIHTPHIVISHHLVKLPRVVTQPTPSNPFNSKSSNANTGVNMGSP